MGSVLWEFAENVALLICGENTEEVEKARINQRKLIAGATDGELKNIAMMFSYGRPIEAVFENLKKTREKFKK
ncbi:MAG: hypothetical protein PHD51_02355 [Patescibacteria group bacterium]|nr:hypothetical protein [Patescibacteria group bacterium]MDD5490297.1 hypothetical protein [Patescibacteria group bacterium]